MTVDGATVTIGNNLERLVVSTLGGNDNIDLDFWNSSNEQISVNTVAGDATLQPWQNGRIPHDGTWHHYAAVIHLRGSVVGSRLLLPMCLPPT